MRPLVEEAAKDFHGIHKFSSLATAVYKVLQNQSEFVSLVDEANRQSRSIDKAKGLIQKGLLPRQIKEDIEAVLLALDEEAGLESELFKWDRDRRSSATRSQFAREAGLSPSGFSTPL